MGSRWKESSRIQQDLLSSLKSHRHVRLEHLGSANEVFNLIKLIRQNPNAVEILMKFSRESKRICSKLTVEDIQEVMNVQTVEDVLKT